ncbi:hypothetical protein [Macrococcus armenti]|uniref:Lipoprotein n=1 Tax=Macrococcus armenti TaxID=2875764 RepID=A0ABY3ZT02_9STAP|nr:hypothetical protein [Macrococcus armenti]UOB20026.1 hypothetical protein MRZ06_08280 [Macrococcus armenti]
MAKYKQMLLAGSFASALLLGACGNDGEKKDDTKTEDAAKEESTEDSTEEETTEESTEESTEEESTEDASSEEETTEE